MIAFLALLYIGLLYLLVRFRIVPWNAFWKVSPVIWVVLLFVVLVIPMNWGAPSGDIVVLRPSVAIVPNVAGEVMEVPVQPNTPLKAGDVLFRIDPAPYEAQVRQIEAQLKLADINLERAGTLEQRQSGRLQRCSSGKRSAMRCAHNSPRLNGIWTRPSCGRLPMDS